MNWLVSNGGTQDEGNDSNADFVYVKKRRPSIVLTNPMKFCDSVLRTLLGHIIQLYVERKLVDVTKVRKLFKLNKIN